MLADHPYGTFEHLPASLDFLSDHRLDLLGFDFCPLATPINRRFRRIDPLQLRLGFGHVEFTSQLVFVAECR
jgi:hypothetical protein